jgi:hypothetical protein
MKDVAAVLDRDPGNVLFYDLAVGLSLEGNLLDAIEVCLRGLSVNPGFHKGRLLLSRLYYECGFIPFAVRELELLLQACPHSRAVRRLVERLSPGSTALQGHTSNVGGGPTNATVAEGDFNLDDLAQLDEDKK